jgi:hypothetical protein
MTPSLTLPVFCALTLFTLSTVTDAAGIDQNQNKRDHVMSSMGRLAQKTIQSRKAVVSAAPAKLGNCFNQPDCNDEDAVVRHSSTQSETTIAVDSSGKHVVLGFNDLSGFNKNPISASGFSYSDDGGKTFTYGGTLPSPGNHILSGVLYPAIFGDPDVKYLGGCNFIYSSLALDTFGSSGILQTVVFHRSRDCGHTWEGPFEIGPANNPHGLVDANGNPEDAADKPLMDVDPDTGRVAICWSNFTPVAAGASEISCTHSDNVLATAPTFSARSIVGSRNQDGQGSSIQFFGNKSSKVIVAWSTFPSLYTNGVSYAISNDNGSTWSAPQDLGPYFFTMDQVLGNDRVNSNPSVAVDKSSGPHKNSIYIVYSDNDSHDGADVMMQRSSDGGTSFTPAVPINRSPGRDRAQWFPFVSVDKTTGRAYVFYYDQGVARSGDLTRVSYTFSDDGGAYWARPRGLSREFKAGWGNDANQPNLGDYIQSVAQHGVFYGSYAITHQVGFADGQPLSSMTVPDVEVKVLTHCEEWDNDSDSGAATEHVSPSNDVEEAWHRDRRGKVLLAENFDSVSPGALPAGWSAVHGAGDNTVPWTTSNSFTPGLCGSSNKAFHQEANDSPTADQARWERLLSPTIGAPGSARYVSVDFDVCYDTEDDPELNVQAYDGLFLRVTDLTPGRTLRSVLAEAFEKFFATDGFRHYPKHFPRSNDPNYFEDMSAWAGFSNGTQHVHLIFPGMAGSVFQLRFEYTQDQAGLCSDVRPGHSCGVTLDNVVVRAISEDH